MKLRVSRNVKHSMEPVRFAYKFAQAQARQWGKHLNGVTVTVTSSIQWERGYRGRAWCGRSGRVLLRFAPQLPAHIHTYCRYQNMPTFYISGGHESIVYLAAHEFGHLIGWGNGDKATEAACCKFGHRAVEAWRDRQYNCPAALI